jgi:Trk K+ transport system NAD-binding subunit
MSTLGFGDITFTSDVGRAFSMVVLVSGTTFMLIILPFTFIQFFWAPWMEAQQAARTPREVRVGTRGHVILTQYDAITAALIPRLAQRHTPYVVLVSDLQAAIALNDDGVEVVVGDLDDPESYRRLRIEDAALVAATGSDTINTHVAYTVRGVDDRVDIVATADDGASVDILELAGCTRIIELGNALGQSLARRVDAPDARAHVIGEFDQLVIAEAVPWPELVGRTLQDIGLRRELGISVVGTWDRGRFETARPQARIGEHTVLVMAGTAEQMTRFDAEFAPGRVSEAPVVIIGSGRVGRAVARGLSQRGVDYRIVERDASAVGDGAKCVLGNAADLEVLERAGIMESSSVAITTSDDDMNVYLAIYLRSLRPDIQIVARANLERNIHTLHRAGTNFVMSYASMGANTILNVLERSSTLMIAEGLDVFRRNIPQDLVGKTIADSGIRARTGCTVVSLETNGETQIPPDPRIPLPEGAAMVLIGTVEAEERFLALYVDS